LSALRRADAIVLMALGPDAVTSRNMLDGVAFDGKPVMRAALVAARMVQVRNGEWREIPLEIAGRRVVIVSGLARPAGFHATVRALGAQICAILDYPDHYDYTVRDWLHIQDAARDAQLILTTEKDLVKLEKFSSGAVHLYALGVEVAIEESDERRLLAMIVECANRRGAAPASDMLANLPRGGLH
jgi:tetraacyldisaccharide-1-P 4'-kinase